MTAIRLPETRDLFSRELEFPVTCERVVDSVGDVDLESPSGSAESIGTVLGRCETDEFASVDELYGALVTFVGEAYVGRKGYDDRSSTTTRDEEVSF
ncbi:MAG: hypothetical protein V5A62_06200 [Haloarculaceae archaeon]